MAFQDSSADPSVAGVAGDNSANGPGVWGSANPNGRGVVGVSAQGTGVWGATVSGRAVVGAADADGAGVWGETKTGAGVVGVSVDGRGVSAGSTSNTGVFGESKTGRGVEGYADTNYGVYGQSRTFPGVRGTSTEGRAVEGWSETNAGVWGLSRSGPGLEGSSTSGPGVVGRGQPAGLFEGAVEVHGDLRVSGDVFLTGQDIAEHFPSASDGTDLPAGTVVVLDDGGRLAPCRTAYDARVAGIVSGSGDRCPALVLGPASAAGPVRQVPVAMTGTAWCLADASRAPVGVGDLLTTSAVAGHAQRATDRDAAFGAVIGKALTPLAEGTGQVLVLVGLR